MAGTNIARAGTNIMTRNEYYRILTFRPERFLPGTNIMRHPSSPQALTSTSKDTGEPILYRYYIGLLAIMGFDIKTKTGVFMK